MKASAEVQPVQKTQTGSLFSTKASRTPFIQPKLIINEPGDAYEREADAMAERVMRMTDPAQNLSSSPIHTLQRKCSLCEEEDKLQRKETGATSSTAPASVHQTLSQSGRPLSAESRSFFEPRFGQDFSGVRIHIDGGAAESAQQINALAYTSGQNVVFGSGQYQPESASGQRLLAHELTHVVQQGNNYGQLQRLSTASAICPSYTTGEVNTSRTEPGILPSDVYLDMNGQLLITDFGVDWRHLKQTALTDPLLIRKLNDFETDSSYKINIKGYSDCQYTEGNIYLRNQRAQRVATLFGPQARRRILFLGGAPLSEFIDSNQTIESRARNRSVVIGFMQEYNFETDPETISGTNCRTPGRVTMINDYINLVMCLERAFPAYSSRQILSLLRQLYYSRSAYTSCRGAGCDFWSDVITCGIRIPDPRPTISDSLYRALTGSKVVSSIDMGHVFTGLEAMVCPRSSVELELPGPNWTLAISNEEFATWAGDLGSAVAKKVKDEADESMGRQPWSRYFETRDSLASSEDLLGDIDSFVIRAGLTHRQCGVSAMTPIVSITSPISEVLFNYYNSVNSSVRIPTVFNRVACFTEALGGTVSGGRITGGRSALNSTIFRETLRFSEVYYRMKYHYGYFASPGVGAWLTMFSSEIADLFIAWLEGKLAEENRSHP